MKDAVSTFLAVSSFLAAGWWSGPSNAPADSPIGNRMGATPTCNAESVVPVGCPWDPQTGFSCGTTYNGISSGTQYYFNIIATTCTSRPGCTPMNTHGATPVGCTPPGGGGQG